MLSAQYFLPEIKFAAIVINVGPIGAVFSGDACSLIEIVVGVGVALRYACSGRRGDVFQATKGVIASGDVGPARESRSVQQTGGWIVSISRCLTAAGDCLQP